VLQLFGNVWQCAISNAGNSYQATGFRYTDPYGRIYTMGATGSLQSVQDLNGNSLTITAAASRARTG